MTDSATKQAHEYRKPTDKPDVCAQHQVLQTPTLLSTTRLQNFCGEREILQNEIPRCL